MKRERVWSKCMGCNTVIPAFDVWCVNCEMQRMGQYTSTITFIKRKPGQDFGSAGLAAKRR